MASGRYLELHVQLGFGLRTRRWRRIPCIAKGGYDGPLRVSGLAPFTDVVGSCGLSLVLASDALVAPLL